MIKNKFNFINEHLAKQAPYLMGQDFTLPDAYLFVVLRWTYYFKMDFSAYPHIEHFMNVVGERPAVMKSLHQEEQ